MTPEQTARLTIDDLLIAAGWTIQDRDAMNLFVGPGVAVREAHLRTGFADYLLFVEGKALGVVEAKAVGATLSGVEAQSARYSMGLQGHMRAWRPQEPLPFRYESTGVETFFTSTLDPIPRSRQLFAFHTPQTLAAWVQEDAPLRRRLQDLPPLDGAGLWRPQVTAITNLEQSMAQNKPRALVQMATGSGKTFTAVNFVYRLIRHAKAQRVLFLVDRTNLGDQALKEFRQFDLPGVGRKFTDDYNVQHLQSNHIDPVSKVCISTIQRLFSILRGEELGEGEDEGGGSLYAAEERGAAPTAPRTVSYTPATPLESFDVIIIDECHRSIYNVWRQVLEYFDAYLIGLTATPSKQTIAFFHENLVMEYTHQDAVADGINVNGYLYEIRTRVGETGATIPEGAWVVRRDRQTRDREQALLDESLAYTATDLGRNVINESQIRLVLRTFREKLYTDLFPERSGGHVPKTLIFAKDDNHAEDVVRIARQVFDEGNDFCQKITYRASRNPDEILADFRNSYFPRMAVTVDMIATGTDVQAIEVLVFLRAVKSRNYFEQMRGRGTRVISLDKLQQVTQDAQVKDRFVIVDAVGLADQPLMDSSRPLERKPTVPFPKLVEMIAYGQQDEETVSSLAARLARLERRLTPEERDQIERTSGGLSLPDLTRSLLHALDYERQVGEARLRLQEAGQDREPSAQEIERTADELVGAALHPWRTNVPLRQLVLAINERSAITYDEYNLDVLREAGFNDDATALARSLVTSFEAYIQEHKDEITALRILYERPYGQRHLTYEAIKELAESLHQPPRTWTTEQLWRAYAQVERDRVRGVGAERVLTDLVSLVRHALYSDEAPLAPYPELVAQRYADWLAQQEAAGRTFRPEQRWWLDKIADYIGVNLAISRTQLQSGPFLVKGGLFGAQRALGGEMEALLDELNAALVVV